MVGPLRGRTVALGVTGSVACYKAVDLASKLVQAGATVDVIMTEAASRFLSPLTFQAIVHRPVLTDLFDPRSELGMDHLSVARRCDLLMVAPATANTIARLAMGLADDALTATALATRAPVIVAPAMEPAMFEAAATQESLERLRSRGYYIAGPAMGRLASGETGRGRLLEPPELVEHARLVLGRAHGDLVGRRLVVTAGGTQEDIDPVRFISNRSSGKMGYAIAEAARDRGADVVLVSAPTALSAPVGVALVKVRSARELRQAVLKECRDADALIMAAAVADWTPASPAPHKLKKGEATQWTLDLERTPDILAETGGPRLVKVGFAAETEDLIENARAKLEAKGLDLIAANDVTQPDSGFGADTNRVALLDRHGNVERLPLMTKYEVGNRILDRVRALLSAREGA